MIINIFNNYQTHDNDVGSMHQTNVFSYIWRMTCIDQGIDAALQNFVHAVL